MLYLVYILIGLLIVLGVNLLITAFWALHGYVCEKENADLPTFKKYFVKNNNIPTKMSDLFNQKLP